MADPIPSAPTLEQLLADLRGDAQVLRRHDRARAELLEQLAERVAGAAEPWLTKLYEDEAVLKSGHKPRWFRTRHAEWMAQGLAGVDGTGLRARRWYRDCIVPQRAHLDAAREDARAAALEEARAEARAEARHEAREDERRSA